MNADAVTVLLEALALPPAALVHERVAKALLIERGRLGAADRRLIDKGLERLTWRATLKPADTGLAGHVDETRDYGRLVVMTARLRGEVKADRLIEVVHRAVAQPLVLIAGDTAGATLSVGLKRGHEREADRVVIDRLTTSPVVGPGGVPLDRAFLDSLALAAVPAHDLWSLHTGWGERIEALSAARITGAFRLATSAEEAHARREALDRYASEAREAARLKRAAAAEKRMARRLDLAREAASARGRLDVLKQTLT